MQQGLFELMKERIQSLIQNASDFNNILKFLNFEQRSFILESVTDRFFCLINTERDLNTLFEGLSVSDCNQIFALLIRHMGMQNLEDILGGEKGVLDFINRHKIQFVENQNLLFDDVADNRLILQFNRMNIKCNENDISNDFQEPQVQDGLIRGATLNCLM